MVAKRVKDTLGRMTAKRLLPEAAAAGLVGSPRTFSSPETIRRQRSTAGRGWPGQGAHVRAGMYSRSRGVILDRRQRPVVSQWTHHFGAQGAGEEVGSGVVGHLPVTTGMQVCVVEKDGATGAQGT